MDSPAAKTNPALEIADLTIEFGGLLAVDSLTFSVEPGACVGLVGPNGAGKSTLIQAINGF
ncbi:MAG: ATP-binding cassette domain-containing protein, partial [Kiloniellales bacterium]|nr:ATP-binding cassette domain-containing protein [Kiloniellales bacterium]